MGLVNDTLARTLLHRRVVVLATNRIRRRVRKPQVTDHFAGFFRYKVRRTGAGKVQPVDWLRKM